MPLLFFLTLFIGVPIAEIVLLLQVGDLIGLWATIGAILATAFIGTALIRYQGLQVIGQAQNSVHEQRVPIDPVIHGVFLLVAGALLLTPGFITDFIGFMCLIPQLRLGIARMIWARIQSSGGFSSAGFSTSSFHHQGPASPERDGFIEGEFTSITTGPDDKPDDNSPWASKE